MGQKKSLNKDRKREKRERIAEGFRHSDPRYRQREKQEKYFFHEILPTEQADWRGIVLPSTYKKLGPKSIAIDTASLPFSTINSHLFFWDRLALAKPSKAGVLEVEGDLLEVLHNRVLGRKTEDSLFDFSPRDKNATLDQRAFENQVQIFRSLDQKDPGRWSIAISDTMARALRGSSGRVALVKLHQAIPVPTHECRLWDIAEFKDRYAEDLKILRQHLEELFLKISNSRDGDLAFKVEFGQLADSLGNLSDKLDQRKIPFRFDSLKVRIKWDFDLRTVIPGLAAVPLTELKTALAIVAAGIASNSIPKIEVEGGMGTLPGKTSNPLRYASLISEHFIR